MGNAYFRVLPVDVQQALGRAAFNAYINFPPPFQFKGRWEDLNPDMQMRWLAIVETIFNQIEVLEGHVQTKLELFNQTREVLQAAVERFERIKPDDSLFNNYQLLEWLRSANAEVVNARLLMLRADIEANLHQDSGVETTQRVSIPNVRNE